mmetsp:Transcript_62819/g.173775  ORF Transcript_62819/g.173775 Transcript_62819/m.173775 type:complete len:99 (+) Transcript_62819:143-439(+)
MNLAEDQYRSLVPLSCYAAKHALALAEKTSAVSFSQSHARKCVYSSSSSNARLLLMQSMSGISEIEAAELLKIDDWSFVLQDCCWRSGVARFGSGLVC